MNIRSSGRKLLFAALASAAAFCALLPPLSAYEDVLTTEEVQGTLENTRLNEVFEQYLATVQMFDPERATRLGLHASDSILTQRSQERVNKQLDALKKLRAKLHEITKESMYPALQVDYALLDHMLETDVYEMEKLDFLRKRPQYYLEPLFSVYQLLSKEGEDYNVRAANAMARLKEFPWILQQAERNLAHPPAIWADQALRQTEDALTYISDYIPLFRGYTRYDPVLKTQVDDAFDKVKAGLARYRDFLKADIIPNADGEFIAGEYTYGFYLERWHVLDMTPGAAFKYARKTFRDSVKDLQREALNIDAMLTREKGWKGVLDKLPKEHPPLSDVLKVFQDEADRAYQHFDEYKVVEFPKQRLLMMKMPGFMAAVLPYAYFIDPFALDDLKVSELYISLPPEKGPAAQQEKILSSGFNYAQIELLTAYDVMPGMHLRSYAAGFNRSRVRKIASQPMVTNGWATYAELLAEEMGYYSSYWSRFLRIYVRSLRAGRACVDAGLHTRRMTYDESVKFFMDNFYFSEAQAKTEVLRISLTPTESLSYILGMDRILAMRKFYQKSEEKYFDLRKFHSSFLKMGKIPMVDIEAELKRQNREAEKKVK